MIKERVKMSDKLTLEKIKISERLESLEVTVNNLDTSVKDIKEVLFGEKGEGGVVHKLTELNQLANGVKNGIGKVFWAVIGVIGLGALPYMTDFLNRIMHHSK